MHDRIGFGLLLTILVAAELTCSLESTMIYVALASLYQEYGDPAHVGWVITAFLLTAAGTAAVCGRLGDIYGRSRMLVITLGVAAAGSALSAVASSLTMIIAGRVLQGASMAILPLCYGLLREHAAKDQIAFGVGILGATYSIGVAMGAVIGGVIVETLHWQGIFVVSGVLAGFTLLLVILVLPSSPVRRHEGPFDVPGALLLVPGVALLLLSIERVSKDGLGSGTALSMLGTGIFLIAVWIWHELRHPNPLIQVRLLYSREILFANLGMFLFALGPLLQVIVLMPLLQQPTWSGVGLGVSAITAGLFKTPSNITASLVTVAAGYFARRIGLRQIVLIAILTCTVSWTIAIFYHQSVWMIVAFLTVLMAPAASVAFAFIPNLVLEAAPEDRVCEATGLTQVIRSIGMAIGAQLLALQLSTGMVSNPNGNGQQLPSDAAYTLAMIYIALFSLLSFFAILYVPKRHAKQMESALVTA